MKNYDGLILSTNGSKSFFEVGVYTAFLENNVNIKAISSAGMGTINACFFAMNDTNKLIKFWSSYIKKGLFRINDVIATMYRDKWSKQRKEVFKYSFLRFLRKDKRLDPLKETLVEFIDEDKVINSNIDVIFNVIDIDSLNYTSIKAKDLDRGYLLSFLLIAITFPEMCFISLNNIAPAHICANEMIKEGYTNILSTEDNIPYNLQRKITTLKSNHYFEVGTNLSFKNMKKEIGEGFLTTLKTLDILKGKLYYINNDNDELYSYFIKKIGPTHNKKLDLIVKVFLDINYKRALIKNDYTLAIKHLLSRTSFRKEYDIYLSLIENLANILKIDVNKHYTFTELLYNIELKTEELINKNSSYLDDATNLKTLLHDLQRNVIINENSLIRYYLLLTTINADKYEELLLAFRNFPAEGLLGIVTLIFILN